MGILPKHIIKSEKAQTTAEFVVVIPFLLFLFFLMVDFSWLLKNWLVVTNAGREVARCAIVDNCSLDGTPVDPEDLATARIGAGITSNLSDTSIQIWYRELAGVANAAGPGDSLVVCIQSNNEYISPVMPFLSMISGGAGSNALPDPLPLRAREEMLFELAPTFPVDEGDCDWDP